jgi:hypothetical protein
MIYYSAGAHMRERGVFVVKTSAFKIISLILMFLLVTGSFLAPSLMGAGNANSAPAPDNWCFLSIPGPMVDLNPNAQWMEIDGQLYAITVDNGQIVIFGLDSASGGESANWREIQRLSIPDTSITTFKVKDINNDNLPEIIAGTVEPGFIRIYRLIDGKWITNSNEKYVWSSITNIVIGHFDDPQVNNILVQNQKGMLYLLKITGDDNALDLVWQSPSVWRAAESFLSLDFDHDGNDEIMVSYKAGGIGILKAVNKEIVSIWDNYLWGKILSLSVGDWDDDQKPELFLSTSQKIIYILGFNNKTYQFEGRLSNLSYTTEKLFFAANGAKKQLLLTDTAGKLHFLEYYSKGQNWVEQFMYPTGRVAQIITPDLKEQVTVLLLGLNRKMLTVNALRTKEITLKYQDTDYNLTPPAWNRNNELCLAPKALANIPGFGLTYSADKSSFRLERNGTKVVVKKENDNKLTVTVNGAGTLRSEDCLLVNRDLYISIRGLGELFKMTVKWEFFSKNIQFIEAEYTQKAAPIEETY